MNTNKIKLALCALCGVLLFPSLAGAYEVTESNAVKLSDDTVLFSITYKFGFLNRESLYPIRAQQGEADSPRTLDFQVRSAGEIVSTPVSAVVLTEDPDVSVRDGMYHLDEGENAEFTLIGLLRLTDDTPRSALELTIERLPYVTINDNTTATGEVRASELPDYRTPQITITDQLTITATPTVFTTVSEK